MLVRPECKGQHSQDGWLLACINKVELAAAQAKHAAGLAEDLKQQARRDGQGWDPIR